MSSFLRSLLSEIRSFEAVLGQEYFVRLISPLPLYCDFLGRSSRVIFSDGLAGKQFVDVESVVPPADCRPNVSLSSQAMGEPRTDE